jgi:hypothetical protein
VGVNATRRTRLGLDPYTAEHAAREEATPAAITAIESQPTAMR